MQCSVVSSGTWHSNSFFAIGPFGYDIPSQWTPWTTTHNPILTFTFCPSCSLVYGSWYFLSFLSNVSPQASFGLNTFAWITELLDAQPVRTGPIFSIRLHPECLSWSPAPAIWSTLLPLVLIYCDRTTCSYVACIHSTGEKQTSNQLCLLVISATKKNNIAGGSVELEKEIGKEWVKFWIYLVAYWISK